MSPNRTKPKSKTGRSDALAPLRILNGASEQNAASAKGQATHIQSTQNPTVDGSGDSFANAALAGRYGEYRSGARHTKMAHRTPYNANIAYARRQSESPIVTVMILAPNA